MSVGKLEDRVVSETAHKIKSITHTPLPYQGNLNKIMMEFKLDGLDHAVIPFAYDGTPWFAITQANSKIRVGSLNNEYSPWTMLLYALREAPLILFDEVNDDKVDKQEYYDQKKALNLFMRRVENARQNNKRLFEEDDALVCASKWFTIAECADWIGGSKFNEGELLNGFRGDYSGEHIISIHRNKQVLKDICQRLDGAFLCDLDPFIHATKLMNEEDGRYSQEDTLWVVVPEANDMEKATKIINTYLPIIAARGGKFFAMIPETEISCLAPFNLTESNARGYYDTVLANVEYMPGYVIATNLEFA